MKTTIKLLALAFVLFATACNNDDEIDMFNSLWRNVTQNEARINDLEEWCAQANTNITSLQTIVNVIESNDKVTSITPVMEGGVEVGYTITFSNHDPITIYHGKDGKDGQNGANGQDGASPIVGVAKHTDGVYYWTLNGEWLLDENGNKLRVSGADGQNGTNGQNGITPQLKIENDYWWISYDNGNTWTQLGKAKGDTGATGAAGADGQDGDSMFQSVTQDAANVYFTLADGTVIIIAKGVSNFTPAAFSVSADKQVYFSPGNLQYIRSSDTWQFASSQLECIGTDNVTGGEVTFDDGYEREGTALADKIDLFGWGTGSNPTNTSQDGNYYSTFVDWGANQIGSDAPNTWRTLTYAEWDYLRNGRTNASSLRGVAQVNGVNGLILLPDDWACPAGITFKSGFHGSYGTEYYAAYQTFTAEQWSQLEAAGAVFLPAAGSRYGSNVYNVQNNGDSWSATEIYSSFAYSLYFNSSEVSMGYILRCFGHSVRLVQDL